MATGWLSFSAPEVPRPTRDLRAVCDYLAVPIVASTVDSAVDRIMDTVVLVLLCMVLPPSVYSSPINPILPLWTDNFGLPAEPVG